MGSEYIVAGLLQVASPQNRAGSHVWDCRGKMFAMLGARLGGLNRTNAETSPLNGKPSDKKKALADYS